MITALCAQFQEAGSFQVGSNLGWVQGRRGIIKWGWIIGSISIVLLTRSGVPFRNVIEGRNHGEGRNQ